MICGFFDGSYYREEEPIIISVAGFVAPLEAWAHFDETWQRIVGNPKLPSKLKRFHAANCVNHTEEFADWGFAERLGLWGDLVGLIANSGLIAISSILVCEHFYALSEAMQERMGNPYHLPVESVMQFAVGMIKEEIPSEKIGFIFDVENQPVAEESHRRYLNYMRDPAWREYIAGAAQASSFVATPLQAADLLAYGGYRLHREHFYPGTPKLDFPLTETLSRLINNIENTGGIYAGAALQNIADQITAREGIK